MSTFQEWDDLGFSSDTPVTKATQIYWNQFKPVNFMQAITVELRQELSVIKVYGEILLAKTGENEGSIPENVLEKIDIQDMAKTILKQQQKMKDILEVIWEYSLDLKNKSTNT